MDVGRRGSAVAAVVLGIVLLGGPAWAQEDPCAPGPDGSVPEMCQSGMPVSDTGTVGMDPTDPTDPCLGLPVEPGDGVVSDPGIAVGEPNPGAPVPGDAVTEPAPDEPKPEPARVDPEQVDPATVDDASREGAIAPDTVICAFSAPVADGAPESAAGGGVTTVRDTATNGAVSAGQLPRTGPYDQALAAAALGSALVLAGAGAVAAGRRRI